MSENSLKPGYLLRMMRKWKRFELFNEQLKKNFLHYLKLINQFLVMKSIYRILNYHSQSKNMLSYLLVTFVGILISSMTHLSSQILQECLPHKDSFFVLIVCAHSSECNFSNQTNLQTINQRKLKFFFLLRNNCCNFS